MADNRNYIQHAMLFGTYMGGFWIVKFILFPLGLSIPFLSFLFVGLTICVPFLGYRYTRMYRDTACGGSIGFAHAWIFTVFMYMFAALLTAVAHYLYFQFMDHGHILNACEAQAELLSQSGIAEMEVYANLLRDNISQLRAISPIGITLQLLSGNVFFGSLLAIPTALFVLRRKK